MIWPYSAYAPDEDPPYEFNAVQKLSDIQAWAGAVGRQDVVAKVQECWHHPLQCSAWTPEEHRDHLQNAHEHAELAQGDPQNERWRRCVDELEHGGSPGGDVASAW